MTRYGFKLYITKQSAHSETAQANLKSIYESLSGNPCDVTVLDAADDPNQAEVDHIVATPTLIKEYPLSQRRVLGNLSDLEKVKKALRLDSQDTCSRKNKRGNSHCNGSGMIDGRTI